MSLSDKTLKDNLYAELNLPVYELGITTLLPEESQAIDEAYNSTISAEDFKARVESNLRSLRDKYSFANFDEMPTDIQLSGKFGRVKYYYARKVVSKFGIKGYTLEQYGLYQGKKLIAKHELEIYKEAFTRAISLDDKFIYLNKEGAIVVDYDSFLEYVDSLVGRESDKAFEKIYQVVSENGEEIGKVTFEGKDFSNESSILDKDFAEFLVAMFDKQVVWNRYSVSDSRIERLLDLHYIAHCARREGYQLVSTKNQAGFYLQYNGKKAKLKFSGFDKIKKDTAKIREFLEN